MKNKNLNIWTFLKHTINFTNNLPNGIKSINECEVCTTVRH